jgi:tetratricopeptide (TPR) repeat protein
MLVENTAPRGGKMTHAGFKIVILLLSLLLGLVPAWSQTKGGAADLTAQMAQGYDLIQAGKLDQAQDIYQRVLQADPGNPLALNNLAAIMVKKGDYKKALGYLEQARPRAKGYKVYVGRMCDINGVCLALRPSLDQFSGDDLASLIDLNISMVKITVIENRR